MPEQPTHLWRDDGRRFTRGEDGLYTMDDSEMARPYQYPFRMLMGTGKFFLGPPPKLPSELLTCNILRARDLAWATEHSESEVGK